MDLQADLVAPCAPEVMFELVDDLAAYPRWMEIVTRAEPSGPGEWAVDLRGRVGPLARSKRLRMVRTEHEAPRRAVFERIELDGRQHSPWRMVLTVDPHEAGCRLEMRLHYGGNLFVPVIERVLRDEIERSRGRLLGLVSGDGGNPSA